jgi:hypothetical protein
MATFDHRGAAKPQRLAKPGKSRKPGIPQELKELAQSADPADLRDLVLGLVAAHPELGEQCRAFLAAKVPTPQQAATQAVFSLWHELEHDLEELDDYGGGPEEQEETVYDLLAEIAGKLAEGQVPAEDRGALLDEVIPYIASRNSGMEDSLYDVAYAACYNDEDLRDLARRFEAMEQSWPIDHARRIYRRIGDRDKYLALRALRMEYGLDYYDLATYHWEAGERERAIQVAREGLERGQGKMDELRQFLGERALEAGDRSQYLELQFAQATGRLTKRSYQAFRRLCSKREWQIYEPRMLAVLSEGRTDSGQRLLIHLLRKEYEHAAAIIDKMDYPVGWLGVAAILEAASRLEARYPQRIMRFYESGLGRLDRSDTRKEYARNAHIVLKIRRLWIDVLHQPEKWQGFARRVKSQNFRRPALREEFARVIPDWEEI